VALYNQLTIIFVYFIVFLHISCNAVQDGSERKTAMGGINHQPCGAYLRNSTRLSRQLSLAFAHLELANVALEDVIIAELDGENANLGTVETNLARSLAELDGMSTVVSDLRCQMETNSFKDLPSLRRVDLDAVGISLAKDKRVELDKWNLVCAVMRCHGFYGMLDVFNARIVELKVLTDILLHHVSALGQFATRVKVVSTLEQNRPGNIRPEFAALYTAWSDFHSIFLASSLVSTELWYAWNGFGSLASGVVSVKAA